MKIKQRERILTRSPAEAGKDRPYASVRMPANVNERSLEEKGGSAMEALNRAFANVCSLLIVTTALIQFDRIGRNAPCKFWESRVSILRKQVSVGGRRWYCRIGQ